MHCPECGTTHIRKNGKRKGKQNHICVASDRQFIDAYEPHRGYSDEVKRECLKMSVNASELRAIERVKGVHHTTMIKLIDIQIALTRFPLFLSFRLHLISNSPLFSNLSSKSFN